MICRPFRHAAIWVSHRVGRSRARTASAHPQPRATIAGRPALGPGLFLCMARPVSLERRAATRHSRLISPQGPCRKSAAPVPAGAVLRAAIWPQRNFQQGRRIFIYSLASNPDPLLGVPP